MRRSFAMISLSLVLSISDAFAVSFVWAKAATSNGPTGVTGRASALDRDGNSYITGAYSGVTTFGTALPLAGGSDAFIAKYNSLGVLQWVRRITGPADAGGWAIACDYAGNVYATGTFRGVTTFESTNALQNQAATGSGFGEFFLVKYDPAGNLKFLRKAGGATTEAAGLGVAVDNFENAYVVGRYSNGSIAFPAATLLNPTFASDIFIAKYNAAGVNQWARRAGGAGADEALAVNMTRLSDVYVTGRFSGSARFETKSLVASGVSDFFVARYTRAGNLVWIKTAGGTSVTTGRGIGVSPDQGVYVTGTFNSNATFDGHTLTSALGPSVDNLFVARYDAQGNLQWVKKPLISNSHVAGFALRADQGTAAGAASVAGSFQGTAQFGTSPSTKVTSAGQFDAFLAQYDALGNVVWALRAGGTGTEHAYGLASTADDARLSVTGRFDGTASFGSVTLSGPSNQQLFLAKLQ